MSWETLPREVIEWVNDLMNARWSFLCAVILIALAVITLAFGGDIVSLFSET